MFSGLKQVSQDLGLITSWLQNHDDQVLLEAILHFLTKIKPSNINVEFCDWALKELKS